MINENDKINLKVANYKFEFYVGNFRISNFTLIGNTWIIYNCEIRTNDIDITKINHRVLITHETMNDFIQIFNNDFYNLQEEIIKYGWIQILSDIKEKLHEKDFTYVISKNIVIYRNDESYSTIMSEIKDIDVSNLYVNYGF